MAQPPPAMELDLNCGTILARLRNWAGFTPFFGWNVVESELQGYAPDHAEIRMLLSAPPGTAVPAFGAALEVRLALDLAPDTGAVRRPAEAAAQVRDARARVLALTERAARDPDLSRWLAAHDTVVARYEEAGPQGRLTLRADGPGEFDAELRFFPPIE